MLNSRQNILSVDLYGKINQLLRNRYLPRWVILAFDLSVTVSGYFLAYNLRYSITSLELNTKRELLHLLPVLAAYLFSSLLIRPYAGVIRHTTSHDIQRIFWTVLSGSLILVSYTLLTRLVFPGMSLDVPLSVILIHSMITVSVLTFSRLVIKYIYSYLTRAKHNIVKVMICGAGDLGQATLLAMERSADPVYSVAGFIDINKGLQGKEKSGIRIYSPPDAMNRVIPEQKVEEIVITIKKSSIEARQLDEIVEYALRNRIIVRKVPNLNEWLNGGFEARQLKKISIDDLLSRDEIKLNNETIREALSGKRILVTGAAGSIGAEIVRQLAVYKTGELVLLDQAESALYDLQMELIARYNGSRDFKVVIADISDRERIETLFKKFRPQIVYNAAAYKHVPLLEDNVYEAVRVNIGGTKTVADLAVKYGAERFVMISSDKAVNPTSVMGATKRVCEMYVQATSLILTASGKSDATQFITTRFGNVLGSNGSVVPLFTRQIEAGGPLTVTHREMRRYFMTIPEACQLVLEAGFMGNGGEIFVFDMGEPVKIWDLAEKMITLAGLEPGKDISIIETGLRPGEKMYEEVLASREHNKPTHHEKILIAMQSVSDPGAVARNTEKIIGMASSATEHELVEAIRDIVPEFIPQNPKYSSVLMTSK